MAKKQRDTGNPLSMLHKSLRRMVEAAMESDAGSHAIRTTKGHIQIRATNGETMCISRNSGSGHNLTRKVEADLRRCFPESIKN